MAKIFRVLIRTVPRNHTELHEYELCPYDDGTYPIYKKVAGARKTEHLLDVRPQTIDDAAKLVLDGHPARFVASGPTYYGNSVLSLKEQNVLIEYQAV